jgi:hypothetical protein
MWNTPGWVGVIQWYHTYGLFEYVVWWLCRMHVTATRNDLDDIDGVDQCARVIWPFRMYGVGSM